MLIFINPQSVIGYWLLGFWVNGYWVNGYWLHSAIRNPQSAIVNG
jgi:hypothetical protein